MKISESEKLSKWRMENMREEIVYYYAYYYKEEIHWTCKSEETLL